MDINERLRELGIADRVGLYERKRPQTAPSDVCFNKIIYNSVVIMKRQHNLKCTENLVSS